MKSQNTDTKSLKSQVIKIIFIFMIGVAAVVACVFSFNYSLGNYVSQNEELASLVNISGRQRTVSQKISKSIYYLAFETDSTFRTNMLKELDSLNTVFSKTQLFLKDKVKNNKDEDTEYIRKLLKAADPAFNKVISLSEKVVYQLGVDSLILKEIQAAEKEFLPLMDDITGGFEILAIHSISNIKENINQSNQGIAIIVFLSASLVLVYTLITLRRYSRSLNKARANIEKLYQTNIRDLERLQFLVDTIQVGIWQYDGQRRKQSWSEKLYEMLGYKRGEIKGNARAFMERVHPKDLSKLTRASDESMITASPRTVEIRVRHKKGHYIWVSATGNVRYEKEGNTKMLIGGVVDISDRKQLENQLVTFIQSAPAAIAIFDKQVRYIACSDRWMLDYDLEEEVVGKSHYELFPEIGQNWKDVHQLALQGEVVRQNEEEFKRADGSSTWIRWEVRPWYDHRGEIGGIIMTTSNITQLKQQQIELMEAKANAERSEEIKTQFLSTMSHEIRTPLNAIIGTVNLLEIEYAELIPDQKLSMLKFSCNNLLSLINDILDFQKMQANKLELRKAEFNLKSFFQNTVNSWQSVANDKGLSLQLQEEFQEDAFVEGDEVRLSQILNNLISNAIKFTKKGGVTIATRRVEKDLHIDVSDTGIGIAEDQLPRVFGTFEQLNHDDRTDVGGTGLGLAITRNLVELMGGRIMLKSKKNEGSTFSLIIPMIFARRDFSKTSSRVSRDSLSMDILLVDDNQMNQVIASGFLEKWGCKVITADNGKNALERLKEKKFDVVLMDMRMPVMNGYEATKEIRSWSDPYYSNVPIIALTASAMQDQRDKMIALGVTEYIPKPFNPEQLYRTLAEYKDEIKKYSPTLTTEAITSERERNEKSMISDLEDQVEQFARLVDQLEQGLDKESTNLQQTLDDLKSCLINLNLDRYLGRLNSPAQNSLNLINTLKAELFSLRRMV